MCKSDNRELSTKLLYTITLYSILPPLCLTRPFDVTIRMVHFLVESKPHIVISQTALNFYE